MTRVVICCGVGGVGKTTTSAALALRLATRGQRVCVLTIDPARRLADALGVQLGHEPSPVDLDAEGSLHALMLDRKATWDGIIRRFAPDEETASSLLANRYYRAVSTRLGGSQEYMAMEKLYELVQSETWDVVVVDTPPTQHALDFFRAPDRIHRLLDKSVLGILIEPGRGLMQSATRRVVKVIHRMAGERVIGDIAEFFTLFSGLSSGFRQRSRAVAELLASPRTSYWLVTTASAPARADALSFLGQLSERKLTLSGIVVNRVVRPSGVAGVDRPESIEEAAWASWQSAIDALIVEQNQTAQSHAEAIADLAKHTEAALHTVPDLGRAIADVPGLLALAEELPDV